MKSSVFIITLFGLTFLVACTPTDLSVSDPWAREASAGGNSAIYFVIDNPTAQEDALLSSSSDVAEAVELHSNRMEPDGTMKMQHQDSIPVPAKGQVALKPGGLHIMLIHLKRDLNAGDTIPLVLKFHYAGEITLEVPVRQP